MPGRFGLAWIFSLHESVLCIAAFAGCFCCAIWGVVTLDDWVENCI